MPTNEYRSNGQRLYDAYYDWAISRGMDCEPWTDLTELERQAWRCRFEEIASLCKPKSTEGNYH